MCVSHAQAGFLKYFLIYWVLTDLSVCFSIQSSPHMWLELLTFGRVGALTWFRFCLST